MSWNIAEALPCTHEAALAVRSTCAGAACMALGCTSCELTLLSGALQDGEGWSRAHQPLQRLRNLEPAAMGASHKCCWVQSPQSLRQLIWPCSAHACAVWCRVARAAPTSSPTYPAGQGAPCGTSQGHSWPAAPSAAQSAGCGTCCRCCCTARCPAGAWRRPACLPRCPRCPASCSAHTDMGRLAGGHHWRAPAWHSLKLLPAAYAWPLVCAAGSTTSSFPAANGSVPCTASPELHIAVRCLQTRQAPARCPAQGVCMPPGWPHLAALPLLNLAPQAVELAQQRTRIPRARQLLRHLRHSSGTSSAVPCEAGSCLSEGAGRSRLGPAAHHAATQPALQRLDDSTPHSVLPLSA